MKCYIDMLSAYRQFSGMISINNSKGWKFFKKSNNDDSHFFINYGGITIRYYPSRYGVGQVWVTFSIGKLLRGTNLFPLDVPDIDTVLYEKVSDILMDVLSLSPTDSDISGWEVSRADFFILHPIEPGQRKWYLTAYKRLSLGAYVPYEYLNTFYLNSTLKRHRAAGTVVRVYDKPQEIFDTSNLPPAVEKDFESYMVLCDELCDFIRIEFQFRRRVLRYFFNHAKSVTVADIMQEDFQKARINRMIERLGLHRPIISRQHMRDAIKLIFSKKPTRQKAAKYISLINSRGTYPKTIKANFTEGEIRYICKRLHDYNLHTIVSEFENLQPVKLL